MLEDAPTYGGQFPRAVCSDVNLNPPEVIGLVLVQDGLRPLRMVVSPCTRTTISVIGASSITG